MLLLGIAIQDNLVKTGTESKVDHSDRYEVLEITVNACLEVKKCF